MSQKLGRRKLNKMIAKMNRANKEQRQIKAAISKIPPMPATNETDPFRILVLECAWYGHTEAIRRMFSRS